MIYRSLKFESDGCSAGLWRGPAHDQCQPGIYQSNAYAEECEVAAGFETVNSLYWRVNKGGEKEKRPSLSPP